MSRYYFSILTEYPKNVISSQVIEYIEFYDKEGINFSVIFLLRLGEYLKGFSELSKHKSNIEKKINGKVFFFPSGKKPGSWFNVFISYVILLIKFRKYKNDEIVLHCRGSVSGLAAEKLKRRMKNVTYIYDVRADQAAEYNYYAITKGIPEKERLAKLKKDRQLQIGITKNASKIFFVSDVLKQRFVKNCNIELSKTAVIPCLADHTKFYFNENLRNKVRKQLKIEEKFVFVYPGGIGYWHYSDTIFEIIGNLMKELENIFFIILTPSVTEAEKLASEKLVKGKYFIESAERDEVAGFLNAADMGVLLRERDPLNEVAAPTKFAEYIMTGLPVLISDFIGDYSQYVKEKNLGLVLKEEETVNSKKIIKEFLLNYNLPSRKEIAEIGLANFSKIKYAKIMAESYKSI